MGVCQGGWGYDDDAISGVKCLTAWLCVFDNLGQTGGGELTPGPVLGHACTFGGRVGAWE